MNLMERFHRYGLGGLLEQQRAVNEAIEPLLKGAVFIDAQSVWDYVRADGEYIPDPFEKLTPMVPPFPVTLFRHHYEVGGLDVECGVMLICADCRNGPLPASFPRDFALDASWAIHGILFIRPPASKGMGSLAKFAYGLDVQGMPFPHGHPSRGTITDIFKVSEFDRSHLGKEAVEADPTKVLATLLPIPENTIIKWDDGTEPSDDELPGLTLRTLMSPAVMASALLNCKNVVLDENLPSRQVRRDNERRKLPSVSVYTLRVETPGTSVVGRKVEVKDGAAELKRLHICRGHFSTYTEERKLFGKYAGTFWIPAHVRGSEKAGKVIKDYAVHPRNK